MRKGQKMSDESKAKMSVSQKLKGFHKGKAKSQETRAKISAANKGRLGRKKSEEEKAKIRNASIGRKVTAETKMKLSICTKRQMSTPEARQRSSFIHKGKEVSAETKAKLSLAATGRVRSKESRQKQSGSMASKIASGEHTPYIGGRGKRTAYNGKTFRSTYEAAAAKKFDEQGKAWLYEPKRFRLSSGRVYIPDFLLTETNEWIEVKGWWYPGSKDKFELFKADYPEETITVYSAKEIFAP